MLKRGFKTWSENIAVQYRNELSLQKIAPLDPFKFASHLKVPVLSPKDLTNLSDRARSILLEKDSSSWSALTINNNNKYLIIYNSSNAFSRQSNDIMHELSHIIIGHKPQKAYHSHELNILIRDFNTDQEDEANWLASTLLLPKDALFYIKFHKIPEDIAAQQFGVSKVLLNMRLNLSGVNYIHKRAKRKYH